MLEFFRCSEKQLISEIYNFIHNNPVNFKQDSIIHVSKGTPSLDHLSDLIYSITFFDEIPVNISREELNFVFYEFYQQSPEIESIENNDESVAVSNHYILPSSEFHGLWESLIYDENVKENLLEFVQTTMLFARKKIDSNIINCNRLVLLHGPAGKQKTDNLSMVI